MNSELIHVGIEAGAGGVLELFAGYASKKIINALRKQVVGRGALSL